MAPTLQRRKLRPIWDSDWPWVTLGIRRMGTYSSNYTFLTPALTVPETQARNEMYCFWILNCCLLGTVKYDELFLGLSFTNSL